MANTVDISEVPVDVNPSEIGVVSNPFKRRVILGFNGKKYLFKASQERSFPLPIALHFGNHLAQMLVFEEHEKKIIEMATKKAVAIDGSAVEQVDDGLLMKLRKESIPQFKDAVWEKMKVIVKSDSDFFKSKNAKRRATGRVDSPEDEENEDEELL